MRGTIKVDTREDLMKMTQPNSQKKKGCIGLFKTRQNILEF